MNNKYLKIMKLNIKFYNTIYSKYINVFHFHLTILADPVQNRWIIYIVFSLFILYTQDSLLMDVYCDDGTNTFSETNDTHPATCEPNLEKKEFALSNLYLNLKDKARRKLFWEICECDRGNYSSYKDFKKSWDSSTKIRNEVKKDLQADLHKLRVVKQSIYWILNRRKS